MRPNFDFPRHIAKVMQSLLFKLGHVRQVLLAAQDSNPAIATGAAAAFRRDRSRNATMILASEVAFVTT
jgi:pyrimidine deaminase RibD-like protein